jgi:hypothetical protein
MAESTPAIVLTRNEYHRMLRALAWLEPKIKGGWGDEPTVESDDEVKTIRITGPAEPLDNGTVGTEETLETDDGEDLEFDEGEDFDIDPPEITLAEYVYPGEFVVRDMSSSALGTDEEWRSVEVLCWAYELQGQSLREGGLYQCALKGYWNQNDGEDVDSRALVEVQVGGGSGEIIRVTGKPRVIVGRRWYPGIILTHDPLTQITAATGPDVWLLQCVNGELATSGSGNYAAVDRGYSFEICGVARRVYETDNMRRLIQGACDPVTGQWKAVFEGPFEGDDTSPCSGTTTTSTTTTTTTTPP